MKPASKVRVVGEGTGDKGRQGRVGVRAGRLEAEDSTTRDRETGRKE